MQRPPPPPSIPELYFTTLPWSAAPPPTDRQMPWAGRACGRGAWAGTRVLRRSPAWHWPSPPGPSCGGAFRSRWSILSVSGSGGALSVGHSFSRGGGADAPAASRWGRGGFISVCRRAEGIHFCETDVPVPSHSQLSDCIFPSSLLNVPVPPAPPPSAASLAFPGRRGGGRECERELAIFAAFRIQKA